MPALVFGLLTTKTYSDILEDCVPLISSHHSLEVIVSLSWSQLSRGSSVSQHCLPLSQKSCDMLKTSVSPVSPTLAVGDLCYGLRAKSSLFNEVLLKQGHIHPFMYCLFMVAFVVPRQQSCIIVTETTWEEKNPKYLLSFNKKNC